MARSNHVIALVIVAAVALTVSLLAFVAAGKPALATGSGTNGLIAFVSDRDSAGTVNDEIYVMNPDGSEPTRLTENPAQEAFPAVSPNGKEIVFASTRHDPNSHDFQNPTGDLELYVMDAKDDDGDGNGDNLRRLTNNEVTDSNPSWSPGGQKVAYTNSSGRNGEVYVMDAEDNDEDGNGDEQTNLTNSPGFDGQPVFSPDGSRIAFLSGRDGNNEIYVMNSDGSEPTPFTITAAPVSNSQPEFSPQGGKIAFTSSRPAEDGTSDSDIWVLNADESENTTTNVPKNLSNTGASVNDRFPAWSPDGTKIAFWSGTGNGFGSDSEIMVMKAQDGSEQANLTRNQKGDITPDWGPAFDKGSWSASE